MHVGHDNRKNTYSLINGTLLNQRLLKRKQQDLVFSKKINLQNLVDRR